MNKVIWIAFGALLFALCFPAEAQQPGKVPRIGFLQRRAAPTPANPDPLWDAFLKGLREFGYIDGNNIKIEHRYAEGRSDRLDAVIAEFIQLKVDVIVVPVVRQSVQPEKRPKRYPLSSSPNPIPLPRNL